MSIVLDNWASYLTLGGVILAIIWSVGIIIMQIMKTRGGIKLKSAAGEINIGEDANETPAAPEPVAVMAPPPPQEFVERRANPHECTQTETLKMILSLQLASQEGLIALLQATKGQINGNVDRALNAQLDAKKAYMDSLISRVGG